MSLDLLSKPFDRFMLAHEYESVRLILGFGDKM